MHREYPSTVLSPEETITSETDSLCPPEAYSPVAHFYHLCLLNPTGLCSAASLPLPISGVLGGLTELMQQKGHKPRLAPRQRLKQCELLVTAATLFQQDHIQGALHSRIYCHLFATPVPRGCPQSPLSHLLEGEDLVCKYSIRKPKDLTGAETPHEVLEIFWALRENSSLLIWGDLRLFEGVQDLIYQTR